MNLWIILNQIKKEKKKTSEISEHFHLLSCLQMFEWVIGGLVLRQRLPVQIHLLNLLKVHREMVITTTLQPAFYYHDYYYSSEELVGLSVRRFWSVQAS